MSDSPASKRLIDPTITTGNLLQVGVLVVGFGGYLLTSGAKVDSTAREVQRLETQVAQQATQTRESIRESVSRVESVVSSLQTQVGALPTMAERMRQLDADIKKLHERDVSVGRYLDERRASLDARFQSLEQRAIESAADRREMRAALDGMQRASGVSLPGSPGRR